MCPILTYGNGQINYGTNYYFNNDHGIFSHTYLYPASGSSASQIKSDVSAGAAYVNYTAHGYEQGWADPSFTNTNANNMTNNVHIRLIVSRGLKKTPYQHPNVNIKGSTTVIIPEYKKVDKKINKKGINLVTVDIRRGTSDTQDPRLNTLSKLNCILACIEADKAGADEGIMLDINGNVSTCNSTNFFIIRKGEVWTSKGMYCLPGITRKMVINLCKENNIPIYEKDFSIEDVHTSDEAFVTGTFAGIIPAINIDGYKISNGVRGKLTHRLQKYYSEKLINLYTEK